MSSRRIDVDGLPVLLCGVGPEFSTEDEAAMADIVRAARRRFEQERRNPERQARALHRQVGRQDGTWGCRCGWKQDKPHREHVADMVAAATTTTPETGA